MPDREVTSAPDASGLLIVQDFVLNDDKRGPLPAALFNMMVGAYATGEILQVITESGFAHAHVVRSGDRGNAMITAVKA